ncbi:TIGR01244 family sulfur transferase [Rubellimicrobium roseum]|uniref:TIGR01244 family phosphatase n=1 Tax=Rubellimicrobium roseum TaxID=687525 RepID=A0A5C4NL71_9RHOB|nr:TIGR01244 family sulfur transferase [Rubellimicrobium roseum]TNC73876.1 TIGR01244 family phosphatase [Rubellimicrobium roseum]
MDIRRITPDYAVSPQIAPEDVPELVAAGFRTVVCNRPDSEIPMELSSEVMRITVEAAGLTFVDNPVTHPTMTPERIAAQAEAMEKGPVLAYCASGTRSSILWSLAQAGRMPTDEILSATARAGYDLSALRPRLDLARG